MVTAGNSVFDVCSHALDFFALDFWKGQRSAPESILEVHIVGSHAQYRVRTSRVREWSAGKAAQVRGAPGPLACAETATSRFH